MVIEEVKGRFQPRKLESQVEFDRVMNAMNVEQEHMNHPYLDELRNLSLKRERIETEILGLKIKLSENKRKRIMIEQQLKDINRAFHDLKHELITMNPKEGFAKDEALVELA